jgi:hypothetical protein
MDDLQYLTGGHVVDARTLAPLTLADWIALPVSGRFGPRAPYDRPCPACGDSMLCPTSCRCDFERRVMALAGFDRWDAWSADWSRANVVAINRAMRALDDSGSLPTNGRYNLTDRAIGRVRRWLRDGGCFDDGLSGYVRAVDHEIGRIVNS